MRHMSSFPIVIVALAGCALVSGCEKLTSKVQAVSIVTSTPRIDDAQGFDENLASVLAGVMPPEGTAVLVGIGERESITSTEAPAPITDASASISFGDTTVSLCAASDPSLAGNYQATNIVTEECGNDALSYQDGVEYTTTIETSDDTYEVRVVAPAPVDPSAVEFSPALADATDTYGVSLKQHDKGQDLTLDWSGDAEASKHNTIITVIRLNYVGDSSDVGGALDADNWQADANNPVFDNAPKTPVEMIDLITNAPPTSIKLDGDDVFSVEGLYMVVVTSTELSTDTSSNLAVGSGALAGRGVGFVFYVK